MPRIDPLQLLNCLTVLLNPNGGILSKNEVQRLASLMTKFSKKLVSKCVYILILKNTETQLLGQFMLEGGWNLVHLWMQDGINNQNWALVKELLELLIMAPTDIEQLKTNNLPKLVKSLTKREDAYNIGELSNNLVENWLKIVRESQNKPLSTIANNNILSTIGGFEELTGVKSQQVPVEKVQEEPVPKSEKMETVKIVTVKKSDDKSSLQHSESYKITVRDGKAVLCKIAKIEPKENIVKDTESSVTEEEKVEETKDEETDGTDGKEASKKKESEKKEKPNHDKHRSRSSSKSSSPRSSSSRDREKSRDKSRDKDRRKSSSSSSRSKDKTKSDKDKHRSNGSVKSSSSKSSSKDKEKEKKESKEKQAEKDKDTLTKIQPQALQKIGRIPKKDEKVKEEAKKPTFSIEVRKGNEEKPKTVKVYNAKMRSTGLLDEPKPPPPRPVKKPVAPLPTIPPPKRPSPIREMIPPPEKKSRIEPAERPGAIKLIPPKPKPAVLQESDIFMDALTASANTKKEPKKRKRRASVSKDAPQSPPDGGEPTTPTTPAPSLITPPNFYQDTLETESEEKTEEKDETKDEDARSATPTDTEGKMEVEEGKETKELKGVLVHVKKKGPKRSIRWKADSELVEVQYFELDETERINVYKTFGEMSKMEMCGERQALQMSRNRQIPIDDNMEPKTLWRHPIEIDLKAPLAEPGSKSLEKDIQFAREKTTVSLPPFIRLTDSPAEPDPEVHPMTDPVSIPLEDPENAESSDATAQPWPEPKGSPPHVPQIPQIFPIQQPFPNFNMAPPPQQFQNGPFVAPTGFMPPNMMQGNVNVNMGMNGPNMMPNMPPEMMNQGPPNMFAGPKQDNYNQNANFNQNAEFTPFNQNQNMMYPQNNFNMRGRGGFRGRGLGGGPWVRMNGPGPGGWNQRGGGMTRGAPPGRLCKNVRNHGYCRNRDNCPFFHPN